MVFNAEYLPEHLWQLKEMKFAHLVQGDMTKSEYVQRFLELDMYSLKSVMNEGKKARKFEWGIRHEIR